MSSDTNSQTPVKAPSTADMTRRVYAGAVIALGIVVFLGFQQFYLHGKAAGGRPLTPPIFWLVVAHGVLMTLWLILLLTQALLVTARKVRLHMTLGKAGAVLALCIFILSFKTGVESVRYAPPDARIFGMFFKQFMAVILAGISLFAVFVALGVYYRKRPELHRAMMLAGTLATMGAASDRYEPIASLYRDNVFGAVLGPHSFTLGFGLLFLLIHAALTRSWDRHFAVCWGVLLLAGVAIMQIAHTQAWDTIANFLLGL